MNLLLLAASEVGDDGGAFLPAADRRCQHLRTVLAVAVGQTLRAGVLDGPLGSATVTAVSATGIALACRFDRPGPPASDVLVLAIPRPRVLRRCVEAAASLGFGRVLLTRTWYTDRSHVEASTLATEVLRHHAVLGLEQARRTAVPVIEIFPAFRPFVEDHLDGRCGRCTRVVAHPSAATALTDLGPLAGAFALAIGPERGFTDYELAALAAAGFAACHAGPHPLRVETALAFACGQIAALRSRGP